MCLVSAPKLAAPKKEKTPEVLHNPFLAAMNDPTGKGKGRNSLRIGKGRPQLGGALGMAQPFTSQANALRVPI